MKNKTNREWDKFKAWITKRYLYYYNKNRAVCLYNIILKCKNLLVLNPKLTKLKKFERWKNLKISLFFAYLKMIGTNTLRSVVCDTSAVIAVIIRQFYYSDFGGTIFNKFLCLFKRFNQTLEQLCHICCWSLYKILCSWCHVCTVCLGTAHTSWQTYKITQYTHRPTKQLGHIHRRNWQNTQKTLISTTYNSNNNTAINWSDFI